MLGLVGCAQQGEVTPNAMEGQSGHGEQGGAWRGTERSPAARTSGVGHDAGSGPGVDFRAIPFIPCQGRTVLQ